MTTAAAAHPGVGLDGLRDELGVEGVGEHVAEGRLVAGPAVTAAMVVTVALRGGGGQELGVVVEVISAATVAMAVALVAVDAATEVSGAARGATAGGGGCLVGVLGEVEVVAGGEDVGEGAGPSEG